VNRFVLIPVYIIHVIPPVQGNRAKSGSGRPFHQDYLPTLIHIERGDLTSQGAGVFLRCFLAVVKEGDGTL
jgi:hypothetical protein